MGITSSNPSDKASRNVPFNDDDGDGQKAAGAAEKPKDNHKSGDIGLLPNHRSVGSVLGHIPNDMARVRPAVVANAKGPSAAGKPDLTPIKEENPKDLEEFPDLGGVPICKNFQAFAEHDIPEEEEQDVNSEQLADRNIGQQEHEEIRDLAVSEIGFEPSGSSDREADAAGGGGGLSLRARFARERARFVRDCRQMPAKFARGCRKLNDGHLRWVENHRLGKLWACSIIGTAFVGVALAARKTNFTHPTVGPSNTGQYYLEKQYGVGKSAKHAVNAFEGYPSYTCDDLDRARDQNSDRLCANGVQRCHIPAESRHLAGYSAQTIRQARRGRSDLTDYLYLDLNDGRTPRNQDPRRIREFERRVSERFGNADRLMIKTNSSSGATKGHWVAFRRDIDVNGNSRWFLLDSKTKFQDEIAGEHPCVNPLVYLERNYADKDHTCFEVLAPHSDDRARQDANGDYARQLAKRFSEDQGFITRLGRNDTKHDYSGLLTVVIKDLLHGGMLPPGWTQQERQMTARNMEAMAQFMTNRVSTFSVDEARDMHDLAVAYQAYANGREQPAHRAANKKDRRSLNNPALARSQPQRAQRKRKSAKSVNKNRPASAKSRPYAARQDSAGKKEAVKAPVKAPVLEPRNDAVVSAASRPAAQPSKDDQRGLALEHLKMLVDDGSVKSARLLIEDAPEKIKVPAMQLLAAIEKAANPKRHPPTDQELVELKGLAHTVRKDLSARQGSKDARSSSEHKVLRWISGVSVVAANLVLRSPDAKRSKAKAPPAGNKAPAGPDMKRRAANKRAKQAAVSDAPKQASAAAASQPSAQSPNDDLRGVAMVAITSLVEDRNVKLARRLLKRAPKEFKEPASQLLKAVEKTAKSQGRLPTDQELAGLRDLARTVYHELDGQFASKNGDPSPEVEALQWVATSVVSAANVVLGPQDAQSTKPQLLPPSPANNEPPVQVPAAPPQPQSGVQAAGSVNLSTKTLSRSRANSGSDVSVFSSSTAVDNDDDAVSVPISDVRKMSDSRRKARKLLNDANQGASSRSLRPSGSSGPPRPDLQSDKPAYPFPTALAKFETLAKRSGFPVPEGFYAQGRKLVSNPGDKFNLVDLKDKIDAMREVAKAPPLGKVPDYAKIADLLDVLAIFASSPNLERDAQYQQVLLTIEDRLLDAQSLIQDRKIPLKIDSLEDAIKNVGFDVDQPDWDVGEANEDYHAEIKVDALMAETTVMQLAEQNNFDSDYLFLADILEDIRQAATECTRLTWAANKAGQIQAD